MKKNILCFLVLCIVASCLLLSGCGSKSPWVIVNDFKVTHTANSNIEAFFNENDGLTIGCNIGETHWTNDGGKTWTQAFGASICKFSLDIVDKDIAWDGGDENEICYSKDGGKTWTPVTDFIVPGPQTQIDFIDDMTGWVASPTGYGSTEDGGITWARETLPEGVHNIAAINIYTKDIGHILSDDGKFCTTKDGGKTWSIQDLGFDKMGMVDLYNNKGKLFISILASADISFKDENNGLIVFIALHPDEGYKTWALTTKDGGKTWSKEEITAAEDFHPSTLYLSNDGKYLTLSTIEKRVIVLKHK